MYFSSRKVVHVFFSAEELDWSCVTENNWRYFLQVCLAQIHLKQVSCLTSFLLAGVIAHCLCYLEVPNSLICMKKTRLLPAENNLENKRTSSLHLKEIKETTPFSVFVFVHSWPSTCHLVISKILTLLASPEYL